MGISGLRRHLRNLIDLKNQFLQSMPAGLIGVYIVIVPGADPMHLDQAGVLQNPQVMGYCGAGKMGLGGDLRHPHAHHLVFQQRQENQLPGLVTQGEENLLIALKGTGQLLPVGCARIRTNSPNG